MILSASRTSLDTHVQRHNLVHFHNPRYPLITFCTSAMETEPLLSLSTHADTGISPKYIIDGGLDFSNGDYSKSPGLVMKNRAETIYFINSAPLDNHPQPD